MRKVLIVDDDTIVRITLRSLVNWEALGYHVAADAVHGKQALQCLKDTDIDLVITDMKMPVMNGIELLTEMNDMEIMPKVLVLSGYDDFKLVREAFRLGAYDYLLKADLSEELLTNMLKRLDREVWTKKSEIHIQPQEEGGRLLVDMVMGRKEIQPEFFYPEYLVVQFEIEDFIKHAGRFGSNVEEQLIKPMLEFAQQIPRVASRCVLGSISPSRYVMVYHVKDSAQYQGNVLSTCRQLCKVWSNYMNLPVSAGISSKETAPEAVSLRFEEAGRQLQLRYLKGKAQICCPWETGVVTYEQVRKTGEDYGELLQGILVSDELVVHEEKQKLFARFHKEGLVEAKECCLRLICRLAWMLQENQSDIVALFADEVNYYEKLKRLEEIRSLELWMNNYIRWILDYIQNHYDRRQADLMIRAKRFIMDNYANPELSLGSVAGYVGLNEKYFSSRFTKEEGTTFSNYLTEVRIRKARELMDKTDLRMYEISQQVGYNNVEHFNRVFKKVCQMSPREYKKSEI